jgi:hypothetical protein
MILVVMLFFGIMSLALKLVWNLTKFALGPVLLLPVAVCIGSTARWVQPPVAAGSDRRTVDWRYVQESVIERVA